MRTPGLRPGLTWGSPVSDAPSYHSTTSYHDPAPPPYAPPENRNSAGRSSNAAAGRRRNTHNRTASTPQQQTIGLPPVASAPPIGTPSLHNFRIPNWSTRNAPAARQLHSVIERRASAMSDVYRSGSGSSSSSSAAGASSPRRYQGFLDSPASSQDQVSRPLEDPYLVGDRAAEQARQERLSRESGDDILQREDQQWDWMLGK